MGSLFDPKRSFSNSIDDDLLISTGMGTASAPLSGSAAAKDTHLQALEKPLDFFDELPETTFLQDLSLQPHDVWSLYPVPCFTQPSDAAGAHFPVDPSAAAVEVSFDKSPWQGPFAEEPLESNDDFTGHGWSFFPSCAWTRESEEDSDSYSVTSRQAKRSRVNSLSDAQMVEDTTMKLHNLFVNTDEVTGSPPLGTVVRSSTTEGRTSSRNLRSDMERQECLQRFSLGMIDRKPSVRRLKKKPSESSKRSTDVPVSPVADSEATTRLLASPTPKAVSTPRSSTLSCAAVRRSARIPQVVKELQEAAVTTTSLESPTESGGGCFSAPAAAGRKRGRPRKHPEGLDGQGNRIETTEYKGIYKITYKTNTQVWRVTVYWQGKNHYLGTYESETAAIAAHDKGLFHYLLSDPEELANINNYLIRGIPDLDPTIPVMSQLAKFPPEFFSDDMPKK